MPRRKSPLAAWHRAVRSAYKVDRAVRLAEAVASGDPQRVERLVLRRLLYRLFARLVNRGLK